eukprot:TRINITY_DN83344_c0_g1_i1.p1 TRINITY_DN83344_c0_g1~~TRINITY_DN83344_c0_g1_i1.p1  ORF type:complete len:167 (+),score=34.15 TRINITY_DN83344_c0_g1_i1:57-503(+)
MALSLRLSMNLVARAHMGMASRSSVRVLGNADSLPVTIGLCRRFSSPAGTGTEGRVIEAVKRYVALRKDELSREMDDTSGNREKMLKALETDVSASTKWDDLGFDDLDKVEVLLEVEDEFKHVIPDEDSDRISSVQETVEYLAKNVTE